MAASLALRSIPLFLLLVPFAAGCDATAPERGNGDGARDGEPVSAARIQTLADDYLLATMRGGGAADDPNDMCLPGLDPRACVETACGMLGSFDCDDNDEVLELLQACRGNYGGACLATTCGMLGSFDCDDTEEVIPLIRACRGVHDASCVSELCGYLGSFDCDDPEEVEPIAASCKAPADTACVAFVCSQLSSFDCDDWEELAPIIAACAADDDDDA